MKGIVKSILNGGKLFEKIGTVLHDIVSTNEEWLRLEVGIKEVIQQHERSCSTKNCKQ